MRTAIIRSSRTSRFRLGALGLALGLALSSLPSAALAAISPPNVTVPSSLVMTVDGRTVWSRAPRKGRRVASTIKMLNALVVRERASLDETVVVTAKSARIWNGDVGLVKGQVVTVRQLLDMMLVASANDAAMAAAIHVGGSESRFVRLMNAKATQLGLTGTHATDPHGLGKHETSNARDLSVLARAVMADPVLREVVRKRSVRVPLPHGKSRVVKSTNQLLGHYRGIEGVKTGFTNPAGYCFVSAAKRGQVELVGVVLGAKSIKARFKESRRLLDWGFKHIHMQRLTSVGATAGLVPVEGGEEPVVAALVSRETSTALFDGGGALTQRAELPTSVPAPVTRGSQIGTVTVLQGSREVTRVPLLAAADVPPASVIESTPPAVGEVAPSGIGSDFGVVFTAIVDDLAHLFSRK